MTADLDNPQSDSHKIIKMQSVLLGVVDDVNKLYKVVIEGDNNVIPLVEKVRNHDEFIANVKYWLRFIGGALVLQTISFLVGVVVALAYFLPVLQKLANHP